MHAVISWFMVTWKWLNLSDNNIISNWMYMSLALLLIRGNFDFTLPLQVLYIQQTILLLVSRQTDTSSLICIRSHFSVSVDFVLGKQNYLYTSDTSDKVYIPDHMRNTITGILWVTRGLSRVGKAAPCCHS